MTKIPYFGLYEKVFLQLDVKDNSVEIFMEQNQSGRFQWLRGSRRWGKPSVDILVDPSGYLLRGIGVDM